ncbi:hypothetical protein TKK_0016252 [Trichogramma kaykai]|uniref:Protein PTHB1 n=1 Tax=Trichogramma kaykai TaxID=54128 RepID=A0ABD2W7N4_9HYME
MRQFESRFEPIYDRVAGDRCSLKVAYEHHLKRFPASLVVGPFGGLGGRDFLCVQCLDGSLLFYEQEVFAFARTLKARLLPEPMIYVAKNDVFVTLGSDWSLECYRYQNIAEVGRKDDTAAAATDSAPAVRPDWNYNLGEAVIGLSAVTLSSFEVGIVVLGERTLYCFGDAGTSIKFSKRLAFNPLCFFAYIIEPDGKLMEMLVADTNTMMIYESTTLKWTAQLPFAPVAVARARLKNLDGAIVALSEEGRLEVCYLGTEPTLFVAPPVNRRGFDYVAAERELLEMRHLLKEEAAGGGAADALLDEAMLEAELAIQVYVSPELLPMQASPSRFSSSLDDNNEENKARQSSMCKISLELASYTSLRDVQVILEVEEPLKLSDDFLHYPTLRDKHSRDIFVYLGATSDCVALESRVQIVASYENESDQTRVVYKQIQLPARLLLKPTPPESTAQHVITIKSSEPVLGFSQLFPEFVGDSQSRQMTNSVGIEQVATGSLVSVSSGLMQNRYRLQSSDPLALPLVLQQLLQRLEDKSGSAKVAKLKLSSTLAQQHLRLLYDRIDACFETRLDIKAAMREIGLLTTQLRSIEKRMLRATKERNSRSLMSTGLLSLLEATYDAYFGQLDKLQLAQQKRERAAHDLQAALKLIILLLKINVGEDKCRLFESAVNYTTQLRADDLDWEEITDMGLAMLMRHLQQERDGGANDANYDLGRRRLDYSYIKFETRDDLEKLKRHLSMTLELLMASSGVQEESLAEE